eukprot:2744836-Lingulodinium_polyedra.AAC.1
MAPIPVLCTVAGSRVSRRQGKRVLATPRLRPAGRPPLVEPKSATARPPLRVAWKAVVGRKATQGMVRPWRAC